MESQMSNYTLISNNILQGLGKATRRGIKRCKCGVYNGTRGSFCKNKQCGISLKTSVDHLYDYDAVKLVTGTVRQVYSVRVKDNISECRGFVQLPLLQFCIEDNTNVLSNVALCFVDSCQRSFDNSILKCHEEAQNHNIETEICSHINLALKSQRSAKHIGFDKGILNNLKFPNEMKEKLKLLAADNDSPLVQRVSKDVMAVKCQVTPKQPLGYLHFTFIKGRNNNKGYEKYYCDCTEYLLMSGSPDKATGIKYKCIHYYACIAALSSDRGYLEEFSHFINNEVNFRTAVPTACPTINKQVDPTAVKRNKINILSNHLLKKCNSLKKGASKTAIKKQKYIIKRCKKIVPKIYPIEIKVLSETSLTKNSDNGVSWPFLDWLAFVTESINKTMQFINCGIINTQVFYIPEIFFRSFKDGIPNSYAEQRTDIGSVFYSIMNVNHVKEVFDTPKVKLRIAKKFVHEEQKGYIEYDENNENHESNIQFHPSFIFFLNVGQSTVDESDNCNNAFIIEWLPNICNTTKIGQLKVQYKYGRKSI